MTLEQEETQVTVWLPLLQSRQAGIPTTALGRPQGTYMLRRPVAPCEVRTTKRLDVVYTVAEGPTSLPNPVLASTVRAATLMPLLPELRHPQQCRLLITGLPRLVVARKGTVATGRGTTRTVSLPPMEECGPPLVHVPPLPADVTICTNRLPLQPTKESEPVALRSRPAPEEGVAWRDVPLERLGSRRTRLRWVTQTVAAHATQLAPVVHSLTKAGR